MGVLGSLALGRFAESQLYGVTGHDPASLIAASLIRLEFSPLRAGEAILWCFGQRHLP